MANILIAEDEYAISDLVKKNLTLVGHICDCAFDGNEAAQLLEKSSYDLLILDIMMPYKDGFEVYGEKSGIPTIFLTARDSLSDRVAGLTMGADDYIVKPFEMLELLARVEAVLRRTQKHQQSFELDGVTVDFDCHIVSRDGVPVDCTPREYELLEVLIHNRNIALSRERLLELAWGYAYEGDTRTVDVHIQKLRKKLGWETRIKTVYKLGYRLEAKS